MSIRDVLSRVVPQGFKAQIKRALGMPSSRLHKDWAILEPVGPVLVPHVVLDVGSHNGWFFHCWKDWSPGAVVHAFEPSKEAFQSSMRQYGGGQNVTINSVGLAKHAGERSFQVLTGSRVSNSALAPDARVWSEVGFQTGPIEQRVVEMTTLDAYCEAEGLGEIYLLKVDVQGLELEVLEGAERTLPRIRHVFVESGIRPLYENAPDFCDVHAYLSGRGFHLMAMRAWHRGNHVLMEADMLFRRDDLAPAANEEIDRVYAHV